MKKAFLLIFILIVIFALWGTTPTPEKVSTQLRGNSCIFDGECGSHWSWWRLISIRNPEYRCRMMAASCLGKQASSSQAIISELKAVQSEMPEQYDTHDGIIRYGACIDAIILTLEGKQQTYPIGDFACLS